MKRIYFLIAILAVTAGWLRAGGTVSLSLPDTTLVRGKVFSIPVYAGSSLTGLGVTSYQVVINYSSNGVGIDGVNSSGTISEAWGDPAVNNSAGRISIAGAGTTPLSGSGILFYLRVSLPSSGTAWYTSLSFQSAVLNEGDPSCLTDNGSIRINNPPSITFSPNEFVTTVGDKMHIDFYYGTAPYVLTTTDTSVAKGDSKGFLTGIRPGFCRMVVNDNSGITDTSGIVEVRAFKLTIPDTSILQGKTFLLPVYITDLSLVDISSGKYSVSYNQSLLTALGTVETGSLLDGYGPVSSHISDGVITVTFAGQSRLAGIGNEVLDYIRFKTSDINAYATYIGVTDILFNENVPGNSRQGYFTVLAKNTLTIYPGTASVVVGDSLQFNSYGTEVLPLTWSVSNPSLASIDSHGMLKPIRSGTVSVSVMDSLGQTGSSGNISLFDTYVAVGDTSVVPGDTVEISLNIGTFSSSLNSFQVTLGYDSRYFSPIAIASSGTLSQGWSVSSSSTDGEYRMAAAGTNAITQSGTLLKIRFAVSQTTPVGNYQMSLHDLLLNEGVPLGYPVNGTLTVYTTPPNSPTLNSPPSGSKNQPTTLQLQWNHAFRGISYQLQVSAVSTFASTVFDSSGISAFSVQIGLLHRDTTYYWRVRAMNLFGTSDWSSVWNFTTIAGPHLTLAKTTLDFGAIVREESTSVILKLYNSSVSVLTIQSMSLTVPAFFTVQGMPIIIGGNDSASVTLFFSPNHFGTYTDTLKISSDGGNRTVILNGASPYPLVMANRDSVNFGSIRKDTVKETILNVWDGSINRLHIDSIYTRTSQFTVDKNNGTMLAESLRVNITFIPGAIGIFHDTLFLHSDAAAGLKKIPLTGVSPAPVFHLSAATLSFPEVGLFDSSSMELRIYNFSMNSLTISGLTTKTPDFIIRKDLTLVISGNDSVIVPVLFRPSKSGVITDSLKIVSDGGNVIVLLAGSSPATSISINPPVMDFEKVFKDSTASLNFTIRNSSISFLRIDSLFTRSKVFSVTHILADNIIRYNDSVSVALMFAPDSIGPFDDTLYVVNNSPLSPYKVPLKGIGVRLDGVKDGGVVIPKHYTLLQNYPNPFNPTTIITYQLPQESYVRLSIYNILGQEVRILVNRTEQAGNKSVEFDASAMPSGIYLYRISAGTYTDIRKMLLIR